MTAAEKWSAIVEQYADGRRLCNCGGAYRNAAGICEHGCSANLIEAKYEIGQRLLSNLEQAQELLQTVTDHFADVMSGPIMSKVARFENGVEGIPTIAAARAFLTRK